MARQTRPQGRFHQFGSHSSSRGANGGPNCLGKGLFCFWRKNHLLFDLSPLHLLLYMNTAPLLLLLRGMLLLGELLLLLVIP